MVEEGEERSQQVWDGVGEGAPQADDAETRPGTICLRHSINQQFVYGMYAGRGSLSDQSQRNDQEHKERAGSSLRSPTSPVYLAYLLGNPDLHNTRPGPCRTPPARRCGVLPGVVCTWALGPTQLPPPPWTRTSLRSLGLGTTCHLCCVGVRGSGALLKTGISRSIWLCVWR
jgi:hypothetical protein